MTVTQERLGDSAPIDSVIVGGDVELPFACRHVDGTGDREVVIKARAIQCALSRICAVCGTGLGRPVAFVGTAANADDRYFLFPPAHEQCATDLARTVPAAVVVTTAGFDLVRPARRGDPAAFRPNSVLSRTSPWV
ncbi:MAG: hypothetical protein PGN07_02300 [Aeromicrobium erythreum]